MRNQHNNGTFLNFTNEGTETIASGSAHAFGPVATPKVGVATGDVLPGETGVLALSGVFQLPKSGEAFVLGQPVYLVDGKAAGTAPAQNPVYLGWAFAPASSADTLALIKLESATPVVAGA